MIRYLFLALAIWVAILIIRHLMRRRLSAQRPSATKSVISVQCAYCGLHLPRQEAVQQDGEFFCSREHQQAATRE